MTRQEFMDRWSNELSGLLIASFAENERAVGSFADKGRYMIAKLRQARTLLDGIYDDLVPQKPVEVKAAANGAVPPPVRR